MSETASLLAEHEFRVFSEGGLERDATWGCSCGIEMALTDWAHTPGDEHLAHLAAIIDAHFAERERALVERVEALAARWEAETINDHDRPCDDSEDCALCCAQDLRAALTRPAIEGEGA